MEMIKKRRSGEKNNHGYGKKWVKHSSESQEDENSGWANHVEMIKNRRSREKNSRSSRKNSVKSSSESQEDDDNIANEETHSNEELLVQGSFAIASGRRGFLSQSLRNRNTQVCLGHFAALLQQQWRDRCQHSWNWRCHFIGYVFNWLKKNGVQLSEEECAPRLKHKLCRKLKRRSEKWCHISLVKEAIAFWCDGQ